MQKNASTSQLERSRLWPAFPVWLVFLVLFQTCSSGKPAKKDEAGAEGRERNQRSTAFDDDDDDDDDSKPKEGARNLDCGDDEAACRDQLFFLVDAFETSKVLNGNVLDYDASTAYSLKLDGLRRNDRLYFTTTVRLNNKEATSTEAIARMKVKNGEAFSQQVEALSSSMGEVTLATAGMADVEEDGAQSYLLQMEATEGGLSVERDAGSFIAMVYRRLPLQEALSGSKPGYFFRGFQKITKTEMESLPGDGGEHSVLAKAVPLQKGDLVVATSILSWKSLQEEGGEAAVCDGVGLTTAITVDKTNLAKPTKRILAPDSKDATLRASRVYRASESGTFAFALTASTDGQSACQIKVDGHGALFLYIFRPLEHLKDNLGQAYSLFNSGIVNLEEQTIATSGNAGKVTSIISKEIGLAKKDIMFYETFANIAAEAGESPTTALMQHKRKTGDKVSSIARAMLADGRAQATIYGADAYFAEEEGNETVEVNVSGVNAAREAFKVESVKFIYHQFRLIPKPD